MTLLVFATPSRLLLVTFNTLRDVKGQLIHRLGAHARLQPAILSGNESRNMRTRIEDMGRDVALNICEIDRVNLGCGPNAPAGWLNVDGSWNAKLSHHRYLRSTLETFGLINAGQGSQWKVRPLVHDLTRPLPFEGNSIAVIYGAHVLEHLYLADAQRLLCECLRVLRSGGVIRLVVPDLSSIVGTYLKSKNGGSPSPSEKIAAADKLNEKLGFRDPAPPSGNFLFKIYSLWKDFHHHKWMYDSDSLIHYMEEAGFAGVSEKGYLQSEIPRIEEVEEADRVLNGAGICVEGKKP